MGEPFKSRQHNYWNNRGYDVLCLFSLVEKWQFFAFLWQETKFGGRERILLSNIFWYSLAVINCLHIFNSPTSADENAPQMIIPPPTCFTVVEMHSGLNLPSDLWRQLSGASRQISNIDSSLHRTLWNQSESQFPYWPKSAICPECFSERLIQGNQTQVEAIQPIMPVRTPLSFINKDPNRRELFLEKGPVWGSRSIF